VAIVDAYEAKAERKFKLRHYRLSGQNPAKNRR
jgi:hypothetical protein